MAVTFDLISLGTTCLEVKQSKRHRLPFAQNSAWRKRSPPGTVAVPCHPPRPLRAGRGGVEGAGWAAELERQARIIVTMLADFETVPH